MGSEADADQLRDYDPLGSSKVKESFKKPEACTSAKRFSTISCHNANIAVVFWSK
jgi:hypothetical protein